MKLKSAKGFSIIELLIVIAIIAIVTVIAIPSFSKYRNNAHLREVAQGVAADIQFYKNRAVAGHVRYGVWYYNTGSNCQLTTFNFPGCSTGWCAPTNYSTKVISNDGLVQILGTPSFTSGSFGWGYNITYLLLERRGTMGQGSLTLRHARTNSTARISTSFLGRVWVTYDMK